VVLWGEGVLCGGVDVGVVFGGVVFFFWGGGGDLINKFI